jgi:hypothetical protein
MLGSGQESNLAAQVRDTGIQPSGSALPERPGQPPHFGQEDVTRRQVTNAIRPGQVHNRLLSVKRLLTRFT